MHHTVSFRLGRGVMAGLACLLFGGACVFDLNSLLLPPGDNSAACRTVSPGNEISARIAYRGKATKLNWVESECILDRTSNGVEKLTLVGSNADDGYVLGDRNAQFEIVLTANDKLGTGPFIDKQFILGQDIDTFEVRISSTPSVTGLPLREGTGLATITEYSITGNRVRMRVNFKVRLLEVVSARIEEICGEGFYDSNVVIQE